MKRIPLLFLLTAALATPSESALTLKVANRSQGVGAEGGRIGPQPVFSPDSATPTAAITSFSSAYLSDGETDLRRFDFEGGLGPFGEGRAYTATAPGSMDFIDFVIGGTAGEGGPVTLVAASEGDPVAANGFQSAVRINGVHTNLTAGTPQLFTLNVGDTFGYFALLSPFAAGGRAYSSSLRVSQAATPSAIPESGTFALLGAGLLPLMGLKRRRA